ncbi:hypothetical protein J7E78_11965 [Paenibacillus polymyxa]|jgi:hypothetical protein|uniref:hypothetical protein n=1 Tax=Paenibacillus polymyxa TaxID=1406 RepID=UPI001BE9B705|nr:hypothetical protein [Paenibacillus polymyxa]MBT2284253.1 hypothetical protein [Paenibacillus polymyxa]
MNISDQIKEIIDLVQQAPLPDSGHAVSPSGVEVFYGSDVPTIFRIANEATTVTVECDIASGTATVKIRDVDVDRTVKTGDLDDLKSMLEELILASGHGVDPGLVCFNQN